MLRFFLVLLLALSAVVTSLRYDPELVLFNLNDNQTAVSPLDYWGEWKDHKFHPSPENGRFPFYTLFPDKFVNGDPTNDDANGTLYEHDVMSNQLRYGGDIRGIVDSLDYLQGMGIKVVCSLGNPSDNGADCVVGSLRCWKPVHKSTLGCGRILSKSLGP